MPKKYFGSIGRITHCVACGEQSPTRFCRQCEIKRCTICKKVDTRGAKPYAIDGLPNEIVVFCDIHGRAHQRYCESKPEKFRSDTEYREWLSGVISTEVETPDNSLAIDDDRLRQLVEAALSRKDQE